MSRNKGKRGELEARDLWRRWFPGCQRIYGQSRKGSDAPDIGCPEMNRRYYVEVKRYAKITNGMVVRFFEKADADRDVFDVARTSAVVLTFKADGEPWYVALRSVDCYDLGLDDEVEYEIAYLRIIPWSSFAAALDKIHEVKGGACG